MKRMRPLKSIQSQPAQFPMSVSTEYLGSKRALLTFITGAIAELAPGASEIVDLFSGTGAVSGAFKSLGYRVTANDHLSMCHALSAAVLLNEAPPPFQGLGLESRGSGVYEEVLAQLNGLETRRGGFIYRNYSPASAEHCGVERMYFTAENAARIDTVRDEIERLKPNLSEGEYFLLLTDLVRASTAVSNVAGTYGCYLKRWKPRALDSMVLTPSQFVLGTTTRHEALCMDAEQCARTHPATIAYADPPYTKRQYAAYYHVLETIVRNDEPVLSGTTGLRAWQSESSEFCYKKHAAQALDRLVGSAKCEHFFLSYNEDGQIRHETILDVLGGHGRVSVREQVYRRYRSSALSHKGPNVVERLYCLARV